MQNRDVNSNSPDSVILPNWNSKHKSKWILNSAANLVQTTELTIFYFLPEIFIEPKPSKARLWCKQLIHTHGTE